MFTVYKSEEMLSTCILPEAWRMCVLLSQQLGLLPAIESQYSIPYSMQGKGRYKVNLDSYTVIAIFKQKFDQIKDISL